jgi:hypothetical protein
MSLAEFFDTHVLAEPLANLATADDVVKGDASDDLIAAAIARCSRFAESYCGRRLGVARYQFQARLGAAFREGALVNGAANALPLPAFPIGAVNSVKELNSWGAEITLLPGVDYALDGPSGRLARLGPDGATIDWWPPRAVTIDAWAGYVLPGQNAADFHGSPVLPKDVSRAVGLMATLWLVRFPAGYKAVEDQPEPIPEMTSEVAAILDA